jgi:hypothetical protein
MDILRENLDTAAMVLGYPVLALVIFLTAWFGTRIFRDLLKIFREMRYERWKRMGVERDWDNIEASWMLELDEDYDYEEPVQQYRHQTLELPDIPEQLQRYREDRYERP